MNIRSLTLIVITFAALLVTACRSNKGASPTTKPTTQDPLPHDAPPRMPTY